MVTLNKANVSPAKGRSFFFVLTKAIAFCVIASAPAMAEEIPQLASACRQMPNHDPRCTHAVRNRMHARFGLATLKQMMFWQKLRGVRDPIVVGFLQIKLGGGFAFLAHRNHSGLPEIEVREILNGGYTMQRRIQRARLSEASWRTVLDEVQALDVDPSDDRICVGGSSATIEVIDGLGHVRSRVGDACPEHPAKKHVLFLAETVVAQLPYCAAVYPETYASPFRVLEACSKFEGLKLVAADLNNTLDIPEGESFWRSNGNEMPTTVQDMFDKDIEFYWPGLPLIKGRQAAAQFWAGDALGSIDFEPYTIRAETPDHIRIEGRVMLRHYAADQQAGSQCRGIFRSRWRRDGDSRFRMYSFRCVET